MSLDNALAETIGGFPMPPLSPNESTTSSSGGDLSPDLEYRSRFAVGQGAAQRSGMGWGQAKSRAARRVSGHDAYEPSLRASASSAYSSSSFYGHSDTYDPRHKQRPDRRPVVRTVSDEHLGIEVADLREEVEDVVVFDGSHRTLASASLTPPNLAQTARRPRAADQPNLGYDYTMNPSKRSHLPHNRSAEPAMLEMSEEEIEEYLEQHDQDVTYSDADTDVDVDEDEDIDLNDVRALLDWQAESADEEQYQYHALSSSAPSTRSTSSPLNNHKNGLLVHDGLLGLHEASGLHDMRTPTPYTVPRRESEESAYGTGGRSLHPHYNVDRSHTPSYAKHRHARLFDLHHDAHHRHRDDSGSCGRVRDDRSSPILGLVADDDEGPMEVHMLAGDVPRDALQQRMFSTLSKEINHPHALESGEAYLDDGRSSLRASEDNASVMQEFEMVSPPPPPSYSRSHSRVPRSVSPSSDDR